MSSTRTKLVLMPGLDGTGELFTGFRNSLPRQIETVQVRYPTDIAISYPKLLEVVASAAPRESPYILVAESFSTPLAVEFAASKPTGLKAVVLCAGFVTSPVKGWRRSILTFTAPLLFRGIPPNFVLRTLLLDGPVDESILKALRSAIASVEPSVLRQRLRDVLGCDARDALAAIGVPVLYMQAARDRLVGKGSAEEIRSIARAFDLVKMDGPHLLIQARPDQTAAAVLAFMSKAAISDPQSTGQP
jgi:pimeloyl-ACP methyl ester carboxylesterase